MGGNISSLAPEELEGLQNATNFNQSEIKSLYQRFQRLDKGNKGFITANELSQIPELAVNPLHNRVIELFHQGDHDDEAGISFPQFAQTLSVFSPRAPNEEKLKYAFRVYDMTGTGKISIEDLCDVLHMLVGTYISEGEIDQIAQQTMAEADTDKDGMLSYSEFVAALGGTDIKSKLSVRF